MIVFMCLNSAVFENTCVALCYCVLCLAVCDKLCCLLCSSTLCDSVHMCLVFVTRVPPPAGQSNHSLLWWTQT